MYHEKYKVLYILRSGSLDFQSIHRHFSGMDAVQLISILKMLYDDEYIECLSTGNYGQITEQSIFELTLYGRSQITARTKEMVFDVLQVITCAAAVIGLILQFL